MKSLQSKYEERTPEPENGPYIQCPRRKFKRISVRVCQKRCAVYCKAYKEIREAEE